MLHWRKHRRLNWMFAIERLQQPNMENIMEPRTRWQFQLISHITYALQHLIGPKKL
jgi:hypothetical protein